MKQLFLTLSFVLFVIPFGISQDIILNGSVSVENNQIKNVADPTDTQDAVTKGYVDVRNVLYNSTVRYLAYNSGHSVEILSNGKLFSGLTWSRSGTTITINSNSHGLSNGDNVVVRNMGDTDYLYSVVSNSSANSFQINNAIDSGDVSGTSGSYIPAAGAYNVSDSGASISSPSVGDIQILAIKIYFSNYTVSNTFDLVMPTSLTNGAGENTSSSSMNPPIVGVWNLSTGQFNNSASGGISVWGGTGEEGNYNVFQVGAINTFVRNIIKFLF